MSVGNRPVVPKRQCAAAIAAIEKLNGDIGIPKRLRDVGVREEMIPIMVPKAMEDGCHLLNPRETTAEDMENLYREAF